MLALLGILAGPEFWGEAKQRMPSSTEIKDMVSPTESFDPSTEDEFRQEIADDEQALSRFQTCSNLPPLPEDFRLEDHNILLITVEAMRYDQTSLYDERLFNTPSLIGLVKRGAWSFERAYSPSSGTIFSIPSLFAMTYPSMTRIETWKNAWHGRLLEEETTVAELLTRSGYDTFRISRRHRKRGKARISGFEQGFASWQRVPDWDDLARNVDRGIADLALERLDARASSSSRFFGWVFLVSPHHKYYSHYPDMPSKTRLDRYRQEIRYADEQIGRIIEKLDQTGLLHDTVVIISGDHGEEFKEHGRKYHKTTVYSESIWIPLVVWVPGLAGHRVAEPTQLNYLFPWLFLKGSENLRRPAERRLREEIGPMMRATEGAVVVEIVGHDRMRSALIYKDRKINYDFISNRIELFEIEYDPLEQLDLFGTEDAPIEEVQRLLMQYRTVRASKRRYVIKPKQEGPE